MTNYEYALVTAAKNEEKYIGYTIESVVSQTVLPKVWVIVSDGSTDKTDTIIKRYSNKYRFIILEQRTASIERNFRSQVFAINTGIEIAKKENCTFIGNLDADISFGNDYFATLLERFQLDPQVGLAGGCIYEETNGQFRPRRGNRTYSVPHAVQFFRKSCFDQIGGYVPLRYGGPDWYAEVSARIKGWRVTMFPDLPVYHHKPTSSAEGIVKGGYRQGRMDYSFGSHPLFEVFKCLLRIRKKPYCVYSLARMAGFVEGYVFREKREVSDDFMRYLRKEQAKKLFSICPQSSI